MTCRCRRLVGFLLAALLALAGCGSPNSGASLNSSAGADLAQVSSDTQTGDVQVSDSASSDLGVGPGDATASDAGKSDTGKTDTGKTDASKTDAAADSGPEITVPNTVCGDTFCGESEDCLGCPYDCGECTAQCGDGQCGSGETCATCPSDCGSCATACNNGICEPTESCVSCPSDCGDCPGSCGDGTCGANEDCDGCPGDCGKCSNTPCNPFGSQTCKPNEQCYPYSGGVLVCLGAGAATLGQTCKYLIDCQKGMVCVNSTCTQICDMTGKSGWKCPGGKKCVQLGQPGSEGAAVGSCL